MSELREILEAWSLWPDDAVGVLATLVHAEGSTYRSPGARMLVRPDDTWIGLIGGGCLEGDLLAHAERVRHEQRPKLVRYDATREDDIVWGLGLGCAGIVEILLEPVSKARPCALDWLTSWQSQRAAGALATLLEENGLGRRWALHPNGRFEGSSAPSDPLCRSLDEARQSGHGRRLRSAEGWVAIESVRPPVRLIVFGAGPDAIPVARQAVQLGWDVTLADPRPAYALPDRFPDAQVVCVPIERAVAEMAIAEDTHALVMTHHYLHDRVLIGDLLDSPARYIGLLGPRRRTDNLIADLRAANRSVDEEAVARLHAPAGLDLGSEGPEAIALSVVAEIVAVAESRRGGWLRDRKGPIRDRRLE